MNFVVLAVVALAAVIAVTGDPTECYQCSIAELKGCSELDVTKARKMSCDNIQIAKKGDHNTTSKVTCFIVNALWNSFPITERGCYYAEMENQDVCTYFKNTEANIPGVTDYRCDLCDDDLCNSKPRY